MRRARHLRSFVVGLSLAWAVSLGLFHATGKPEWPGRIEPVLLLAGLAVLDAVSRWTGWGLRSVSLGSLSAGGAVGCVLSLIWAYERLPLAPAAVAGLALAIVTMVQPRRMRTPKTESSKHAWVALIGAVGSLALGIRWCQGSLELGPPIWRVPIAIAVILATSALGSLVGGALRIRVMAHDLHRVIQTPVLVFGLVGLALFCLHPSSESIGRFANQVHLPSYTNTSFLIGVAIIDVWLLGLPSLLAGALLGWVFAAGSGRPRTITSLTLAHLVGAVVLAIMPMSWFRNEDVTLPHAWSGLHSIGSPDWPGAAEALPSTMAAWFAAAFDDEPSTLVMGSRSEDIASRLRESGHSLALDVQDMKTLLDTLSVEERFGAAIFAEPTRVRIGSDLILSISLLNEVRRSLGPGARLAVVERLGRIHPTEVRATLLLLRNLLGSSQLWIGGHFLIAVGGPPTNLRRMAQSLGAKPDLSSRLLPVLDSRDVEKLVHEDEWSRTYHLDIHSWQRRRQPWDRFLAARTIQTLIGWSSLPRGPHIHGMPVDQQFLLKARYLLSLEAARFSLDRRREKQLLALAIRNFQRDPQILKWAGTIATHYATVEERADESIERDHTDAAALFHRALCLLGRGEYEESKDTIFGGAIRWRKNLVEAYPVSADIVEAYGQPHWTRRTTRENGFPHAGHHPDLLESAVRGYASSGIDEELVLARDYLSELEARDPTRPGLAWLQGFVAQKEGAHTRAMDGFRLHLRQDPFSKKVYEAMALSLARLGHVRESTACARLAKTLPEL